MSAQTNSKPNLQPGLKIGESIKRASPGIRDFFVHILGQIRILKKIYPGIMHAMIFWGVTIQVLGTALNLVQMAFFTPFVLASFPRQGWYLAYELIMDLAGVAILLGVCMAAFRRFVLRPKALETRWDDVYALGMLFLIAFIGFFNEGSRILVKAPAWAAWSPVGNWVAGLMRAGGMPVTEAESMHNFLVYIHAGLALVLVASIPFTKMRHLINTPLNILFRQRRKAGELEKIEDIETTEQLGVGKVSEFTPSQLLSFDACVRCGRCEEACPANASGMPYSPRTFIQTLRSSMVDTLVAGNGNADRELANESITAKTPWYCTTCGACLVKCPAFVNPVDEIIDLRRYQVLTTGAMPKSVGDTMRNLERQGNPWGMAPESRMDWAEGLDVRELAPGDETDVLFFVGCAAAFDVRNKNISKALVQLMQKAGVQFGVLGFDEMCCGETARRMGHEYLFQEMAKQNIETMGKIKFKRIVTSCPHCFNTLTNEYSQMGGDYQVLHYTELLTELDLPKCNANGNGLHEMVTFHDSCYLGRYNKIYTQPRKLLDQAGVKWVEMPRHGEDSFCCGGGGGQMWMETDANTRINHRRLDESMKTGAELVATTCPYCLLMFDDAIRSKGLGDKVKVMDITEILAAQIEAST